MMKIMYAVSFPPEFKWQIVQESKEQTLSVSELARKYDVNTNQVFRWVREVNAGQALWVRRAKGEISAPVATTSAFLPVSVRAQISHQAAITVMFRSGHQLVVSSLPNFLTEICITRSLINIFNCYVVMS